MKNAQDSAQRALWIAAINGVDLNQPARVWSGNNIVRGRKLRVSYFTLVSMTKAGMLRMERPHEGGTLFYIERWTRT